jgi:hypothetical protein
MVWLKVFAIFVVWSSGKVDSQLSKERFKSSELKNEFESDLFLMPVQKKMMYNSLRLQKKEAFDVYKWPKNFDGFVVVPYWISRGALFCECANE